MIGFSGCTIHSWEPVTSEEADGAIRTQQCEESHTSIKELGRQPRTALQAVIKDTKQHTYILKGL